MYKVNIPSGYVKKVTAALVNSNKLTNPIKILSTGILVKSQDLDFVFKTFERFELKFSVKKVA
jgi:hypothetical protein